MKKITLKNLNLKEVEQLSREQLKNVLGGYTGGTGGGTTVGGTAPYTCEDGLIPCYCDGPEVLFIGCVKDIDTCWDRC